MSTLITPCFFGTREDNMYAATFKITYKCNLLCKHCMNLADDQAIEGMELNKVLDLITQLYDNGVRRLYITG